MTFADGMEETLRRREAFSSDAEQAAFWTETAPEVEVEDVEIPGGTGQGQAARLYGPAGRPLLVWIHGGGWAGGSVALHEASSRTLAAESGWRVLSPSYRLAPVHPYPAGLDDSRAAVTWAVHAGLTQRGCAIGGASAGGNLAVATALAAPRGTFRGLLPVYGVLGSDLGTASYARYADGPGLTRARMAELFEMYDPGGRRTTDPLIAPLLSDRLGDLPPTFLIAAEHDVLLDDTRAMAARLDAAGVRHELHVAPGTTHGFINWGRMVPAATDALIRAARFLDGLETE